MISRKATPKDIPYILDLYKKGLNEVGEKWVDSLLLKKIVNSYHLAPCFLLVNDDKICGMAGLTSVTSSHNGDAILVDYMFYVEPECRNIESLSVLVDETKKFASEVQMPLKLEFISQNDQKLRERLLKMNGFKVHSVMGVYNG